ncbi:uncharacterized protein LOC128236797 [Mya arenaria]|uniref:uncharacterized protein LOC128236797 n=1 Tax=Mya arenaria TaxID=6604 RepID=UPI0022E977F4|nr:uncharacterized protein LOC128236797 [Mya arenaria]
MDSTLCLVMLSIITVQASAQDSSGFIGNACYGTNHACDFYSLQCPQGEIIHLYNLIAGGKSEPTCRSEQHCSGGLDCCSFSQGDITSTFNLENTYHTYRNCSGRQSCTAIQAPWQRLDTQTFSSYVHIEYTCERASTKIPMCGSNPSIYTSSAEVWFDGSIETFDPTKASKECACTIKNNQIGRGLEVYMYLLDVRLESHYVGNVSSAACSSAQFYSEMIVIQCANTTQHWVTNFKYYDSNSFTHQYSKVLGSGQTTDLGLSSLYKNRQRDAPALVWIKIASARSSDTFEIICGEVTPAYFTTTTTTTTTTPPTTTPPPTTTRTVTTPTASIRKTKTAAAKTATTTSSSTTTATTTTSVETMTTTPFTTTSKATTTTKNHSVTTKLSIVTFPRRTSTTSLPETRTSSSTTAKPVTTIPVTTMGTPMKPRTTSAPLVNATEETTPVSAVVVAVPIACVLATMLAVSTAFFFKERRKRMEAENGNTNTSVRDRSVTRLQEFPSERVYDTIGETNTPEGNYNLGTRNLTNNLAHVYTESAPVAPVQQTNTDADISGQNCGYETLQHSPYQNTDTNGVPCSVYNQLTF